MKYSFTFQSVTSYLQAKQDTSSALYAALHDSTSLSRSCISTIIGGNYNGLTLIDSVNLIVPREKGGEVGDTLLLQTVENSYSWLKGRQTLSGSTGSYGSSCYVSDELEASNYVMVGFVGHREGNKCLLFYNDTTGLAINVNQQLVKEVAWGTTDENIVPSVKLYNGSGAQISLVSFELEYKEKISKSLHIYGYPILRDTWNEIVRRVFTNSATSGWVTTGVQITNGSGDIIGRGWKVEASNNGSNIGVATISACIRNSSIAATYNPADYDYDFDKWYNQEIMVRYPSSKLLDAMSEANGRANTAILNSKAAIYKPASACLSYSFLSKPGFNAGSWWLPCVKELYLLGRNKYELYKKGIFINFLYWSSDQTSETSAVSLRDYGCFSSVQKSSTARVLPVTEFNI